MELKDFHTAIELQNTIRRAIEIEEEISDIDVELMITIIRKRTQRISVSSDALSELLGPAYERICNNAFEDINKEIAHIKFESQKAFKALGKDP